MDRAHPPAPGTAAQASFLPQVGYVRMVLGMRGGDDALTVGDRIAFYRARRGLTQRELGALVGRSTEWVSSVERGRRQVRRMDVLTEVARALRVPWEIFSVPRSWWRPQ